MNSKSLRRLAADHGALHSQPLPPNYLFAPGSSNCDNLTELDILLTGPTHTPFAAGVWKLHLTIPSDYPQQPPTAHFRTPIFHPNVNPETGGVCVETLKRDWDSKLTLRDVLITISCLLIHPNPDSALNAEAGALLQDNYDAFARRAELMTSIHAVVPKALQAAVREAQERGQEKAVRVAEESRSDCPDSQPDAPPRKRRATARQRGTTTLRRSEGSPSGALARRRQQAGPSQPFVLQMRNDDVFGAQEQLREQVGLNEDEDSSMLDVDQENNQSKSAVQPETPTAGSPRRPHGIAVPLGELVMDDVSTESETEDMEPEYPPSPRKSPIKSPMKHQHKRLENETQLAEGSRTAAERTTNITPPNNPDIKPLSQDSPFAVTLSPRKTQLRPQTPASSRAPLFPLLSNRQNNGGIFKMKAPTSLEKKAEAAERKASLDAKLWELCGRDIGRWNKGDFDNEPFGMKAKRW